jgi:HPt (histidine-containing phosphotransfer) domain-containing protein
MDVQTALDRAMGDLAFLEMILKQFLDHLPAQIEELKAAVRQADGEKVREKAHALKGSAANLSATEIASVALSLEKMGRDGDFHQCEEIFGRLKQELERLEAFLAEPDWSHRDHTAEESR